MNVVEFILLAWVGIVVVTVGVDVGLQIWVEKHVERKAQYRKFKEAQALLYASIAKRYEDRMKPQTNIIELKVVELPKTKKPAGGRHRLTAA